MKLSISDPKTRKAYTMATAEPVFAGKKIRDTVDLSALGLSGYKAEITGGSDKEGFPMKPGLQGSMRKKLVLTGNPGFNATRKGMKKKKNVRGSSISTDIEQVNLKVVEYGEAKLEEILKKTVNKEEEKAK